MEHAYDNAFRTMEMDCPKLLIPVVNEVFHENYPLDARVEIFPNEQMITTPEDEQIIRITDSNFMVIGNQRVKYHIECESNPDSQELLIRMFQYDMQIVLNNVEMEDGKMFVEVPKSAVVYLRYTKNTPDMLQMVIRDGDQELIREIPVIKIQEYSLDSIFEKHLLFFLPFYVFIHEKELSLYNKNEEKRKNLMDEYKSIICRLEELYYAGKIDEMEKQCIITSSREVLRLLAKKYRKVIEEGERVMGGELLDYPAKRSYREGMAVGREEGRESTLTLHVTKLLSKHMSCEEVADLLDLDIDKVKEIEKNMMTLN